MEGTYKPKWKNRRRTIFATLLFCAATVAYCLFQGGDSVVHQMGVLAGSGLAGSVIASYVFGAKQDDANYMDMLKSIMGKGGEK